MTLPQLAAIAACALLAGLAVFQAMLAAGLPLGRFAWGGQHDVLPRNLRIGSIVAIVIYGVFALVLLDRAGLIDMLPEDVSGIAAWIIAAYGVLGVGMNAISRSRSERLAMTPTAALLAACSLVVAWG